MPVVALSAKWHMRHCMLLCRKLSTAHVLALSALPVVQEVAIMRKVRHKNIVQFIGACTQKPNLCIVFEFMSGGSVYDYIRKVRSGGNGWAADFCACCCGHVLLVTGVL